MVLKTRFAPTLMDRLIDMPGESASELRPLHTLNLDALKSSVARDLENLLNARGVHDPERLQEFPRTAASVFSYGLRDFMGLSLANPADRVRVCRTLEQAIARHEPRLQSVVVELEPEAGAVTRLRFVIRAMLVVKPQQEHVSFDALLQASTLQYAVSGSRGSRHE